MPAVDWQRLRAVVFDVDGTLYDSARMRRRMAAELLGHCLVRPRRLRLLRILQTFRSEREKLAEEEASGVARLQFERAAARLGVSAERVEAAVREWMYERPLRHLASCRRPGVRRLCARLRDAGRKIGVLSDYPVSAKLEALGLDCDVAVSALEPAVDRLKPHPAGLEHLLGLLDVAPSEALLIGDRDDRDGECARRLGSPYLILPKGGRPFSWAGLFPPDSDC